MTNLLFAWKFEENIYIFRLISQLTQDFCRHKIPLEEIIKIRKIEKNKTKIYLNIMTIVKYQLFWWFLVK